MTVLSIGRRATPRSVIPLLVGVVVLAVGDLLWCHWLGLVFSNWLPFVALVGGVAAIALIYGATGRSEKIAAMATCIVLWMITTLLGAIMTYAAAVQRGPLYDSWFAAVDHAFGLDWSAWYAMISNHRMLHDVLQLAYASLLLQIVFSLIWFALIGPRRRNIELLTHIVLALLLTTALFHLLPALGPGINVPALKHLYIDELVKLRSGERGPFDVMRIEGIVAFPSFHSVLAVLFTYAFRRSTLFAPMAALNTLVVLSAPSEGGHYFVDLLGGIAVAGTSILAAKVLMADPVTLPIAPPAPDSVTRRTDSPAHLGHSDTAERIV